MFDSGEKKSERNNRFSAENFSEGNFSFFSATNLELFFGGIDHVTSDGGRRSQRRLSSALIQVEFNSGMGRRIRVLRGRVERKPYSE